ncbi:hypothetical protein [Sphingobacterium detergens]|uniref:Uncharacterized protein n=1 Tax=Sphingobacterium detergens TaxID=1145106 RepID=A0A420B7S5_SPHD1|nr:hypothetical protein [Sphingobacterium detergens]RKE52698.1 hypothetical protein DFQ12_2940 [Sphingobacterium detergens]
MNSEILKLKRQVKLLIGACLVLFLGMIVTVFTVLNHDRSGSVLDVERINIREADGTIKMVLSNKARQHPGRMLKKDLEPREREAGLIFFNSDGDECGGLVYDNDKESAGMVYSIDKYQDDQIMQLQYMEDTQTKKRKYGLQLWSYGKEDAFAERQDRYKELTTSDSKQVRDSAVTIMRNEGLLATDRMFLGKNYKDEIGLFIHDSQGRPRIRIMVDKNNQAILETVDTLGNVMVKSGI